jgi:adenosylmethionine-8-amino-7-oxononanoate aminotransferase
LASRKNNRVIRNPLAGDEIYLKEQDITRYADAIESFWLDFVGHINKKLELAITN